jgi:hypothetical protein
MGASRLLRIPQAEAVRVWECVRDEWDQEEAARRRERQPRRRGREQVDARAWAYRQRERKP